MKDFYVTLLSDSSLNTYQQSTQSNFTVKLDHPIQIDKENWEVVLTEIILPSDVKNITEENNYFYLRFSDVGLGDKAAIATNRSTNDDGGFDEIEAECLTSDTQCRDFKLYITKGSYVSPKQLTEEMQNIISRRYGKIVKQSQCRYQYRVRKQLQTGNSRY